MTTAHKCLPDTGPPYRSMETSELSTHPTLTAWMSSPGGSRANRLVWQVAVAVQMTRGICGPNSNALLGNYDHESHSWRTSQLSLPGMAPSLLETLPKWGMSVAGALYQLPTPERLTSESAGGVSLWTTPTSQNAKHAAPTEWEQENRPTHLHVQAAMWPTPQSRDYRSGDQPDSPRQRRKAEQGWSPNLNDVVNWPTPTARDFRAPGSEEARPRRMAERAQPLTEHAGGTLNPAWVEMLQGYPPGWTALDGLPD